jgi:transaldolase
MNLHESLKRRTTVVAATGDLDAIAEHRPQDATTNPSLLLHAAELPRYQDLVDDALNFALRAGRDRVACSVAFMDKLYIHFSKFYADARKLEQYARARVTR